jgi:ubiquinone biosynthesis protein
MTARLSTELREQIVRLLMDLADNRGDNVAATLIEVGDAIPTFDRLSFTREIASLMARNYDLAIGEVQTGTVLYELINIAYTHGLRLPAETTLLAKALWNLEAVTRSLDESYSPIDTIREYGMQLATEKARRELSPRKLYQLATESGDLIANLPRRLDLITAKLANNEFETSIAVPQLAVLLSGLKKVANRVFSGLVLAGLLVSSAMLLPYRRALGTVGFVLAGALGLYMVVSIAWGDRKEKKRE